MAIDNLHIASVDSEVDVDARAELQQQGEIIVAQADPVPVDVDPQDGGLVAEIPEEVIPDENNFAHLPAGVTIDQLRHEGSDLIILMADGSEIKILGGALDIPTFVIDGIEVPRETLLVVLQDSGIDVAAGPDGTLSVVGTGPQSSGPNFQDETFGLGGEEQNVLDLLEDTNLDDDVLESEELLDVVLDDDPVIVSITSFGTVDEDGLSNANADNNRFGEVAAGGNASTTAQVVVDFGNDVPANLPASFAFINPGALNGQLFAIGGDPIVFTIESGKLVGRDGNGTAIIEISLQTATLVPGTSQVVYTLEMTLLGSIQHGGVGEDSVSLTGISFSITDGSGDVVTASVSAQIYDDIPVAHEVTASAILDDDVHTGGNPGGVGDVADANTVSGAAGSLFTPGADGVGSIVITGPAMMVIPVDSNGIAGTPVAVTWTQSTAGGVTILTGTAAGFSGPVAELTVNADGSYSYVQHAPVVNGPGTSDGIEETTDFEFGFIVSDGDGDTAAGKLVISINDDTPVTTGVSISLVVAENDILNLRSQGSSPFQQGSGEDSETLLALLGGGFASTVSGSLAGVVSFGADGQKAGGGFGFTADAVATLNALGLTSKGGAVVFTVVGDTIIGFVNNVGSPEVFTPVLDRPVMSLTLDPQTGAFTFRLYDQLDHMPGEDENTTLANGTVDGLPAIDFGRVIQATDGDGDSVRLDGKLEITIKDDVPSASIALTGNVVAHDETPGWQPGESLLSSVANLFSSLGAAMGYARADLVDTTVVGGADDNVTGLLSLRIVGDGTTGLSTADGAITLSMQGNLVVGHDTKGNLVFALHIDSQGRVSIAQYKAIQHPNADGSNDHNDFVDLDGFVEAMVTVTDHDGDTATDSVGIGDKIRFYDDGPRADGTPVKLVVAENDILNLRSQGSSPFQQGSGEDSETLLALLGGGFAATVSGSLVSTVSFGADGQGGFAFTADAASYLTGLDLTSKGDRIVFAIEPLTGVLIGYVNGALPGFQPILDRPVMSLELNADGSFTFRLYDQLDHDWAGGENTTLANGLDAIDFGRVIQATDGDGDSVRLDGKLEITIKDDVPQLSGADPIERSVAEGSSTPLIGTLATQIVGGADDNVRFTIEIDDLDPMLRSLTSGGHPVTYAIVGNSLVATANGQPVFTFTVNPVTGTYSFLLQGPIDHPKELMGYQIGNVTIPVEALDEVGEIFQAAAHINGPALHFVGRLPDGDAILRISTGSGGANGWKLTDEDGVEIPLWANIPPNTTLFINVGQYQTPSNVTFQIKDSNGNNIPSGNAQVNLGHGSVEGIYGGGEQLTLDLSSAVTVRDYDGDELALSGRLLITINDSVPVAVDFDGLMEENEAATFALVPPGGFGADGPGTITLGAITSPWPGFDPSIVQLVGTDVQINPGATFDALAVGQTATILVPYTITDADGDTSSGALTITVTGTNDAPVISGNAAGDVVETGLLPGIFSAGPGGPLSVDAAFLTPEVSAALNSLLTTPGGVTNVLDTIQSELGVDTATAIAVTWKFLDGNFVNNTTKDKPVDEAFVRLGVEYASYLKNGGMPLTEIVAKFTPDNNNNGTPDRLQSLHDNLLGNLNGGPISSRFANDLGMELIVLIYSVEPLLLSRVVYSGNEADTAQKAQAEAWDIAHGFDMARVSGQLTVSDPDQASGHVWAVQGGGAGTYGAFTIDQTGKWTYVLDNGLANSLAQGQTVPESFTVVATDEHGASDTFTVTVTVIGTNDAPTITVDTPTAVLIEPGHGVSGVLTSVVHLTLDDVDVGDIVSYDAALLTGAGWNSADGGATWVKQLIYGSVTLHTAANTLTYTLDPGLSDSLAQGDLLNESVTVPIKDQWGAPASTAVTFTIHGTNDAPVLTPADSRLVVTEDTPAGHQYLHPYAAFSIHDPDNGDSITHYDRVLINAVGNNGATVSADLQSALSTASWTQLFYENGSQMISLGLTLDNALIQYLGAGQSISATYSLNVTDSYGATGYQFVTFTINGVNDDPVITAATPEVLIEPGANEAGVLTSIVQLTLSDVDAGDVVSYDADLLTDNGWTSTDGGATWTKQLAFGSVTLDTAADKLTYTLDAAVADSLAQGDLRNESVTIPVKDLSGATASTVVDFTIHGTNDAPVIDGTSVTLGVAVEDAAVAFAAPTQPLGDYSTHAGDMATLLGTYGGDMGALLSDVRAMSGIGSMAEAFAAVWQYLDGQYNPAAPKNDPINEAFVRLGTAYAEYIKAGGVPLTDIIAKEGPTRLQSLHDNLLGNLNAASLASRFSSGLYDELEDAVDDLGLGLLTRPVFSGNDGSLPTLETTREWDAAHGLTPATTGQLYASDVDTGALLEWSISGPSTYGEMRIDPETGKWSYYLDNSLPATQALAEGQSVDQVFTATVTDEYGDTDTILVTITITGTNDAPTLQEVPTAHFVDTAGNDTFDPIVGTLIAHDPDSGDSKTFSVNGGVSGNYLSGAYDVMRVSAYGQLYLNSSTGAYRYVPHGPTIQALKDDTSVSFQFTVTDSAGASASSTFTINITGANDTASITGTFAGSVTEDGTLTTSGFLTVHDRDAEDYYFQTPDPDSLVGTYGTFTFDHEFGFWSYTLDNAAPHVQALAGGQVVHDHLTVTSLDGTATQTIEVTINGANDGPVAVSDTVTLAFTPGGSGGPGVADSTPEFIGSEPNNNRNQANPIDRDALKVAPNFDLGNPSLPSITVKGSIATSNSSDYFSIYLKSGETLILDVDHTTGNLDTILRIYQDKGNAIQENDDSLTSDGGNGSTSGLDSYIEYTVTVDGTYYIQLDRKGGTSGNYDLNISIENFQAPPSTPDPVSFSADLLLANDYDVDHGDTIKVVSVSGSGVSFDSTTNMITVQYGVTSFDYTIEDSHGVQSTATATVNSVLGTTLNGTPGDDILIGGPGNDILVGGAGNDILIGGAGYNVLTGGAGNDTFVIDPSALTEGPAMADLIMDYTHGEDRIDLSALLASLAGAPGDATAAGTLVQLTDLGGGQTALQVDNNGTENGGSFETVATFSNGAAAVTVLFNGEEIQVDLP